MIRSMTAFSRREASFPWGALSLELRSVNHRYLDVSPRLPEELRSAENELRQRIGTTLSRGKVDLNMRFQPSQGSGDSLDIDRDLALRISHASREVDTLLYNPAPVNSLDVLRWPGVIQSAAVDGEEIKQAALDLLDEALGELVAMREREGARLAELIEQRCAAVMEVVASVRAILPEILAASRERLHARFEEAKVELDPQRLEQEMVIAAQKMDVAEELDRLEAHVGEIRDVLKKGGAVGRRLDFLMQELNREANTLGSKSVDTRTTRASVDLKVLIEQMREQIQNIE